MLKMAIFKMAETMVEEEVVVNTTMALKKAHGKGACRP
jgi:hypothetical protein